MSDAFSLITNRVQMYVHHLLNMPTSFTRFLYNVYIYIYIYLNTLRMHKYDACLYLVLSLLLQISLILTLPCMYVCTMYVCLYTFVLFIVIVQSAKTIEYILLLSFSLYLNSQHTTVSVVWPYALLWLFLLQLLTCQCCCLSKIVFLFYAFICTL